MEQMATIGKVVGTHGVNGGLKVFPYSDYPERVKKLTRLFMARDGQVREALVSSAFVHGRFWVIQLEGVRTRDEALLCVGELIQIPAAERLKLPEDTFYLDEIIGMDVFTTQGGYLGRVSEVLQTGGNDVYVVQPPAIEGGKTVPVLVPALKKVVVLIDKEHKRMEVELPEGLL